MHVIPFLGPTCYAHLVLTPPGCVYHFMVLGPTWCAYLIRTAGCVYHFMVLGPICCAHLTELLGENLEHDGIGLGVGD